MGALPTWTETNPLEHESAVDTLAFNNEILSASCNHSSLIGCEPNLVALRSDSVSFMLIKAQSNTSQVRELVVDDFKRLGLLLCLRIL